MTVARATAVMDAFDRAFYVEHDGRAGSSARRPRPAATRRSGARPRGSSWSRMLPIRGRADPAYARMVGELTRGGLPAVGRAVDGPSPLQRRRGLDGPRLRARPPRSPATSSCATSPGGTSTPCSPAPGAPTSAAASGGRPTRPGKNACVNAPAAIAAARLSRALGDPGYLAKAKRLYAWVRRRLYDSQTGAVYDHVFKDGGGQAVVDRATYTYNQGTFTGAR